MEFSIYQIKRECVQETVECYLGNYQPRIDHYNRVYTGFIKSYDQFNKQKTLNTIFHKFNDQCPTDYQGKPLSVGDVIELGGSFYLCLSLGWNKVSFEDLTSKLSRLRL